jgi:hypothetical protein
MGDRISIEFAQRHNNSKDPSKSWDDRSPALFSHWDGRDFLRTVERYLGELLLERSKQEVMGLQPLYRLEAGTVMTDFIHWLVEEVAVASAAPGTVVSKPRVTGNYYLGRTENDGDNSDNGHFTFWMNEYIELNPTEAALLAINKMSLLP